MAPGNTIASLKKALALGVDIVEFDVHVTADDVAILNHNATIMDVEGDKHPIALSEYKNLKNYKPSLATLDQALDVVDGTVPAYIEVKLGVDVEPVVRILESYKHKYFLGSKSQRTLIELDDRLPNIQKIVIETWSGVRASRRARQLNTRLVCMYQLFLWSGFIIAMKHSGYELYAYTVNNPRKARQWAKYGLAGVVTDYPDRFKN